MATSGREDIPSGAARSEREILVWLVYGARCVACGRVGMLVLDYDQTPDRADAVARVSASCGTCHRIHGFTFNAGPGWEQVPADDDPRLTATDAPSTLLPEAAFQRWIKEASADLARLPPAKRVLREFAAQDGIRGIDELRKLRRAAGAELTPDELQAARQFAEAWVATGNRLPAELAWMLAS